MPGNVHLHDPVGWWQSHRQPFTIADVLAAASASIQDALALVANANQPVGCDPRDALAAFGIPIRETRMWRWPFADGVDYLVCASVTRGGDGA